IGGSAGGYELTLAVNSGDGTPPQEPASIDLQCSMGLCAGVYPLEIRVVPLGSSTSGPSNGGSSSTSRASLLTYLVYSYPSTQKLDFAWTLPLGVASALGGPVGSRSALDQSSLYQFANETSAVAGIPSVPLTLEPVPEIVAQLHASTQAKDRQALQSLEALAVTPGHEILSQSFVPVDASALTDAGLGGELSYQTRRALQILQTFHPDEHEWVSDSTLDPAAVTAISQQSSGGTRDVVVPPSAVTGGGCGVFTCTQPFDLASGNGTSVEAALSDPGLEADLPVAGSGDPALAAHRLLAELALIFLEQPNADDQRAVVLATPASWQPDSVFIRQVLQGLDGSPNIEAVDLDQLFSSVPIGGNSSRDVQPSARRPAVGSTGSGHLAVREVKMMRARLIAFSSAVAPVVVAPLSDDLLASEANDLSANQQRSALYGVRSALDRQLGELKLTTASVRLTSGAARVPISVTKNTPYTVEGLLTVSSDKLVFGSTAGCTPTKPTNGGFTAVDCRMVLSRGSNAVYVDMRSRTAGNFVVSVDLVSPKGGLTLVDGNVSVRSLSTSDVAIALSIGAAVVLLAWWGRTLWRGRRRGRGAHVRGANGSPQ
ncbi:MAG TPA: hypothetical protein VEJ87_06510, partial [Acidimicrobiales bacterium]|nr:hypothetical protein [Acidimicrobiales bacterium]